MNQETINQIMLSLKGVFTGTQLTKLQNTLSNYIPGSFKAMFEKQFSYAMGPLFSPVIHEYEPSTCALSDGVGVSETFDWEGVILGSHLSLKFELPFTISFQNMIDFVSDYIYPREFNLPSREDILKAVVTLLTTHLDLSPVLHFLVLNKTELVRDLTPVYRAIGPRPIHEGVLKRIATEPDDHSQFNSRHIPSSEINRRSMQLRTDMLRSHDLTITAEGQTWKIRESDAGDKKFETYETALSSLKEMECLPACVLDALRLGAHQSGFLNEAVIALGVYINDVTHNEVTLPQQGVHRSMQFTVKNRQVEVLDQCEWHEVGAPLHSPGGSNLDRAHVTLSKPLSMCYRYTLAADNKNKLSHQIKEIFVKNEHRVRALATK